MNFESVVIDHQAVYVSGVYKIVPRLLREFNSIRFFAYVKPQGWVNWGNRVDKAVEHYHTLEEAQAACEAHSGYVPTPHQQAELFA